MKRRTLLMVCFSLATGAAVHGQSPAAEGGPAKVKTAPSLGVTQASRRQPVQLNESHAARQIRANSRADVRPAPHVSRPFLARLLEQFGLGDDKDLLAATKNVRPGPPKSTRSAAAMLPPKRHTEAVAARPDGENAAAVARCTDVGGGTHVALTRRKPANVKLAERPPVNKLRQ